MAALAVSAASEHALAMGILGAIPEAEAIQLGHCALMERARELNDDIYEGGRSNGVRQLVADSLFPGALGGIGGMWFVAETALGAGVIGAAGIVGGLTVGLVAGAVAGCLWARARHNTRNRGSATIDFNGDRRSTDYNFQPNAWHRSERELEVEHDLVGDRILAVPQAEAPPAKLSDRIVKLAEKLTGLDRDRRLLADLGGRSRRGEPALQQISAITAMALLAKGKPVHVLSDVRTRDTSNSMEICVENATGSQRIHRHYEWIERTVDYEIKALTVDNDWHALGDSAGLPRGLSGVPRDRSTYTECVAMRRTEDSKRTYERGGFLEGEFEKIVKVSHNQTTTSRNRAG